MKRYPVKAMKVGLAWGLLMSAQVLAATTPASDRMVLPQPEQHVQAKVGKTYKDSTPGSLPTSPRAPKGAPNVVVVLLDDVGFAATDTFGGPVPTSALDQLAKEGLRYNRFHNASVCGPSRAALLSGRNHHSVNEGLGLQSGYEGYTALHPKSAATIAEILKQNGYNTAMFGKHHNTPDGEITLAGPFDRWPTGLGFEYFYGFNGGETDQYRPTLYENIAPIEVNYPDGYTLTEDLADRAIAWMQTQKTLAPEKPFFVYWAPGATHAPHQVQKEWSDRFKGQFDQGWDVLREESFARQLKAGVIPPGTKLTPRPMQIPSWNSLSPERKKIASRLMEIYAGFLAQTDHEVGRLIEALKASGTFDNTLFFYLVGDNGASGEGGPYGLFNEMSILNGAAEDPAFITKNLDKLGGPDADNHIPVGFAWALNTPFQWTKQVPSHFGGTRSGMVVSWPARIRDQGGLRSQFHHLIDIMPTILEITGIPAPKSVNGVRQKPIDGVSMAYTFDSVTAPDRRKTQYFEMMSNRSIYHKGWMASVFHGRAPWDFNTAPRYEDEKWELYNIDKDFSQAEDLAAAYPKKLAELQQLFDAEARKYNVYPLDDRGLARSKPEDRQLSQTYPRPIVAYLPGTNRISEYNMPSTKNKSFSVNAELILPKESANGVIAAVGGVPAGWSFYFRDNRPTFVYNYYSFDVSTIQGPAIEPGAHTVRFEFAYDGGGAGKGGMGALLVDGQTVARARIEKTVPFVFTANETFDVGMDLGTPVDAYKAPFKFNGTIKKVILDTSENATTLP